MKSFIAIPTALAMALASVAPLPVIAVVGTGLAVSGCAGGSGQIQTDITAVVNAVIAGVKSSCQVSPLAVDVANLIPIYGQNVAAIINAICSAVKAAPASGTLSAERPIRIGVAPVVVHGVVIHFN